MKVYIGKTFRFYIFLKSVNISKQVQLKIVNKSIEKFVIIGIF